MARRLRLVLYYDQLPLASTHDPHALGVAAEAAVAESTARATRLNDPGMQAIEKSETVRMRSLFRELGLGDHAGPVM